MKTELILNLGPGDKFVYKDTEFIIINTGAIDKSQHLISCLDLSTYKITYFGRNIEVEVVYYYCGL